MLPQYVAQFNGATSIVQLPSATEMTGPFTVSLWMYPATWTNTGEPAILGGATGYANSGGFSAFYYPSPPPFTFKMYNSTGAGASYIPASQVLPNRWTFVTFTWDGTNGGTAIKTYINGVLGASAAGITGPLNWASSGNFYLGNGVPQIYPFQGSLADVQIYNATLDANSIRALYLEGIGGAPVNLQSLVAWWPLNGNTNDYSGNIYNGAPTSITYTNQWLNGYTVP